MDMFIASWMSRAPAWWRGIGRRMFVKPSTHAAVGPEFGPIRWKAMVSINMRIGIASPVGP